MASWPVPEETRREGVRIACEARRRQREREREITPYLAELVDPVTATDALLAPDLAHGALVVASEVHREHTLARSEDLFPRGTGFEVAVAGSPGRSTKPNSLRSMARGHTHPKKASSSAAEKACRCFDAARILSRVPSRSEIALRTLRIMNVCVQGTRPLQARRSPVW